MSNLPPSNFHLKCFPASRCAATWFQVVATAAGTSAAVQAAAVQAWLVGVWPQWPQKCWTAALIKVLNSFDGRSVLRLYHANVWNSCACIQKNMLWNSSMLKQKHSQGCLGSHGGAHNGPCPVRGNQGFTGEIWILLKQEKCRCFFLWNGGWSKSRT